MQNNKTTYLNWYDLCVLTLILFGEAIYTSTQQYFITTEMQGNFEENLTFSNEQNYWALLTQLALLLIAMGYLKWRNFDFSRWVIRPLGWLFLAVSGCLSCSR